MHATSTSSWWAVFGTHTLGLSPSRMRSLLLLLLLVVHLISLPSCHARDFTFTVMVEAGKSDCFYDYIHKGAFLEIEYQVCFFMNRAGASTMEICIPDSLRTAKLTIINLQGLVCTLLCVCMCKGSPWLESLISSLSI